MNAIRITYNACPKCTYPTKKVLIGEETDKKGVVREVVRTYCSNKSCDYEKVMRRKKKWQ